MWSATVTSTVLVLLSFFFSLSLFLSPPPSHLCICYHGKFSKCKLTMKVCATLTSPFRRKKLWPLEGGKETCGVGVEEKNWDWQWAHCPCLLLSHFSSASFFFFYFLHRLQDLTYRLNRDTEKCASKLDVSYIHKQHLALFLVSVNLSNVKITCYRILV